MLTLLEANIKKDSNTVKYLFDYHNKHSDLGWLGYCSDTNTDCRKGYDDHRIYIKRHDTMLTNQRNPTQEINNTLKSSLR
jgi:hypothetical protein